MSEITDLSQMIEAEIEAAQGKVQTLQQEGEAKYQDLKLRHEHFVETARRLIASSGKPLQTLVGYFDNAKLDRIEDSRGFHAKCLFKHTLRFPATVELRFDLTFDDEIRNLLVHYKLSILPIFIEFRPSDQLTMPLDAIDDTRAINWVSEKIAEFVKTYLRIQFADEYQKDNLVTDPVAKTRFPKHLSKNQMEYGGRTYYFLSEASKNEFTAKPDFYVAIS